MERKSVMRLSDLDALVVKRLNAKIAFDTLTAELEKMEDKLAEAYRTAPGVSDPIDTDDPRYADIVYEMREVVAAKDLAAATKVLLSDYGTYDECRAIAAHVRRRIRK